METRRLLLAFVLSIAFLVAWNWMFPTTPTAPTEPGVETTVPQGAAPAESTPPQGSPSQGSPAAENPASSLPTAAEAAVATAPPTSAEEEIAAGHEETVVLENDAFRAEFTNRGAQLRSFRLKRHLTHEGQLLELVRSRGDGDPYPFALVARNGEPLAVNQSLFTVEKQQDEKGHQRLIFRHRSQVGNVEKEFTETADAFLEVGIKVSGASGWAVLAGPGARELTAKEAEDRFLERQVGYRIGENLETLKSDKVEEPETLPAGGLRWVVLEDKYFLAALVPLAGLGEVVVNPVLERPKAEPDERRFLPMSAKDGESNLIPELEILLVPSGEELELAAYLGAKKYSRLTALPYGLEQTVRWGFFGFLGRPLYYGLQWIHENVVANYGWAIVLMTFLIKLVFFPLTHKSQESMGKMQELNPKIQAIRNKYRGKMKDRQGRPNLEAQRQMNEEVMAIYRGAGVNPAAGCLPLLLQIPVFFAFYKLLAVAVELRNAPWILWVRDLSVPDPYVVLPILMGVTGILLQRMTPAPPDPMQKRLMQLMPIMFAIFSFAFPAGLVLYWLTNNVLTMGQQSYYLRRKNAAARDEAAGKTKKSSSTE
ncbi:MAG: membrane protein insertase YidC [Thermoanaerobaculia bacterium]|nr:membrane protein insertase YidC [Thermoanaerobaculia bacterium]